MHDPPVSRRDESSTDLSPRTSSTSSGSRQLGHFLPQAICQRTTEVLPLSMVWSSSSKLFQARCLGNVQGTSSHPELHGEVQGQGGNNTQVPQPLPSPPRLESCLPTLHSEGSTRPRATGSLG
ncbi:hypothetical protein Pcinc_004473 [Petrolisthes cinctipes]|uniref:Uncharacterized protein n=1 Tax=Petrolisthes cinctipes TaxID=88211 RepID=A0AAE1L3N8_PETCI|nr:hypothetical protein Pcinc_004473 [Petrolisthes cinctipes]